MNDSSKASCCSCPASEPMPFRPRMLHVFRNHFTSTHMWLRAHRPSLENTRSVISILLDAARTALPWLVAWRVFVPAVTP